MKKILFLHGFGSSGATQTAEYLRHKFPEAEVISPDIPLDPKEALRFLNKLCHEENPDVIIGTSMGAMYAQQMHGYHKIMVNPAFHVSEIMRQNMGVNKFLNPRRDGAEEFTINESLCRKYEEMEKEQFKGITRYDKKHTYAFFGTEDTLVNGYDEYLEYYTEATKYPGEHSLLQKWVKAYIIPCVMQILDEAPDSEEMSAEETYQLLADVSGGGKRARLALEKLQDGHRNIWMDIAQGYYEKLYSVMKTARNGFKKITKEFVTDLDKITPRSFSQYLQIKLLRYFEDQCNEKEFNKYSWKGHEMDSLHAMLLLTDMYINNCGICLGERTIAYDAATVWLKRYNDEHPEEKRWDEDTPFVDVMPLISADYDKEELDHYDICYMSGEEEIEYVKNSLSCYDDDTAAALCWGLKHQPLESMGRFVILTKVMVMDSGRLDMTERALFFNMEDAEKELEKWTEQNREHVLCYIMREIPKEELFVDELTPAICGHTEKPLDENEEYVERVFEPSGFERKKKFKVGDEVDYIYYDGDVAELRHGGIAKIEDTCCIINDSKDGIKVKVPTRYIIKVLKSI